jgi:hypothetical protein
MYLIHKMLVKGFICFICRFVTIPVIFVAFPRRDVIDEREGSVVCSVRANLFPGTDWSICSPRVKSSLLCHTPGLAYPSGLRAQSV